jgi:hypothetical protein
MAVNEKISGDLTISGSIIGGGIVPNITAQNYLPVLKLNPDPTLESSGFYYNNGSLNALYHKATDFGNPGHNFIADNNSGVYQLGVLPDGLGWPNPNTGIKFDSFNNILNITCGSPYNAKFSVAFGQTYIQGGDMGMGFVQMSDWATSLNNFQGNVTIQSPNGISMYSNDAEVYMFAQRVNMQAMDKVIFQAPDVRFADASMFENGPKTQTNRYLRILDENQVAYYLPLYQ